MPKLGVPTDHIVTVENHIAEILSGRRSLVNLEGQLIEWMYLAGMSEAEQDPVWAILGNIRRAVDLGHQYAKQVRGQL